jgi:hypothetical protein
MNTNKPVADKKPTVVEVHDPTKLRGRLKLIGGSMSDDWNNVIANQAVTGRSASPATGTGSRSLSVLHIAGSGAWASCFAWGCSSDFGRSPPPGVWTMPTTRLPAGMHMNVLDCDFLLTLAAVNEKQDLVAFLRAL